ncbi:MAG TPA: LLM class F420-dependent oxidoreductase [Acidimicrobiales bacterium]|nr:LLM class F420-dependent oxidoreductase [Acidimicrobiales bacterium]
MQIGVVLPQTEIGADPAAIAAYARGVSELGFAHVLVYDHVLGADPTVHREWRGPYDIDTMFHEPFVLFGYLAAIVDLELVSGIVILPQRQTALVAKQAAEVDVLSNGKLRLGVGIGWNKVEYDALGEDFATRGRRMEEQVELMRRLWTERSVSFEGRFDTVVGAGISPLPVQRPIPIWVGGSSEPAYRRMGRVADGWFPQVPPDERLDAARRIVNEGAASAGRDPDAIGMEGRVSWSRDGGLAKVVDHLERWRRAGATHVSVNTMGAGLAEVDAHLQALAEVAAEALG